MAKSRVVQFRVSEEEYRQFVLAAGIKGRTVSDWARAVLRARAKKTIDDNP